MQNNPQSTAGYEPQEQTTPYDDQITLPAPQSPVVPPPPASSPQLSFNQGEMPAATPAYTPPVTVVQKRQGISKKILIGGIVILALLLLGIAGAILVPRLVAPANNQPAAATPAATPAANRNVYAPYLAQYREGTRSQIAQGLHLTDAQLEGQLSAGKTLSVIAADQKISTTQLQTIVTNAFQNNFQPAVSSGKLTQKQVDALAKRMLKQPKMLDRYLAAPVRGKKNVSATPTAAS